MANATHLEMLKQGVDVWNAWKSQMPPFRADLRGAILHDVDLRGANLRGADLGKASLIFADLRGADLRGADLSKANLFEADLSGADLREADLGGASLGEADLTGADLRGAHLDGANLVGATLHRADMRGADLLYANLSWADLTGANLTGCRVHGVSAWSAKTTRKTKQRGLVISGWDEPEATVDNIEIAQSAYLLFRDARLRGAIGAIASKLGLGSLGAPARRGKERTAVQRCRTGDSGSMARRRGTKARKAKEIAEPENA